MSILASVEVEILLKTDMPTVKKALSLRKSKNCIPLFTFYSRHFAQCKLDIDVARLQFEQFRLVFDRFNLIDARIVAKFAVERRKIDERVHERGNLHLQTSAILSRK